MAPGGLREGWVGLGSLTDGVGSAAQYREKLAGLLQGSV